MRDTYFVRDGDTLRPVDDYSREQMQRIGQGEIFRVDLKRDRNYRFHKKYWALIGIVFSNQEIYKSQEALHFAIKVQAGWIDHIQVGEKVVLVPRSISFKSMTQSEFDVFYVDALNAVKQLLPMFEWLTEEFLGE